MAWQINQAHILVVDDEWKMRNLLRIYLTREGFRVTEAKDGNDALEKMKKNTFDLVILDIMMPGMDGWELCTKIRQITMQMPILMLTARSETKEKVQGLNLGADDYLVKPFDPEELVARVRALLRRSRMSEIDTGHMIMTGELRIDPERREVWVHDQTIDLTKTEFDLLYLLAGHPGRVYSREMLLDHVWGKDYFGDLRTVDTHVKNIREKFRKAGLSENLIQTVWGIGYKFKEPDPRQ